VTARSSIRHSDRTFGPGVAAVLAEHRGRQDAERSFVGDGWKDNDLVFCTRIGGWIDPNNFSRLMDTLVEQAGVPRITPKGVATHGAVSRPGRRW
jgi:hypothetical protein